MRLPLPLMRTPSQTACLSPLPFGINQGIRAEDKAPRGTRATSARDAPDAMTSLRDRTAEAPERDQSHRLLVPATNTQQTQPLDTDAQIVHSTTAWCLRDWGRGYKRVGTGRLTRQRQRHRNCSYACIARPRYPNRNYHAGGEPEEDDRDLAYALAAAANCSCLPNDVETSSRILSALRARTREMSSGCELSGEDAACAPCGSAHGNCVHACH
jgi:hypothetical protein